jgi:hypothetical protein
VGTGGGDPLKTPKLIEERKNRQANRRTKSWKKVLEVNSRSDEVVRQLNGE